jgi:hypothetical protein
MGRARSRLLDSRFPFGIPYGMRSAMRGNDVHPIVAPAKLAPAQAGGGAPGFSRVLRPYGSRGLRALRRLRLWTGRLCHLIDLDLAARARQTAKAEVHESSSVKRTTCE